MKDNGFGYVSGIITILNYGKREFQMELVRAALNSGERGA